MAGRTPIAVTSVNRSALTAMAAPSVAGDAVNGNVSPNDGATMIAILNADGAAVHNLTVQLASGVDGQASSARAYAVPISTVTQLCGPFPVQWYGAQLVWNVDNANLKVALYSLLGP